MAGKVCQRCGETKSTAHYIGIPNSIVHKGCLPICRECIGDIIYSAEEKDRWNVVDKLCQWADLPFVPEEWEKIYLGHGKDAFGTYAAIFRNQPYDQLDWGMYYEAYKELEELGRREDALPTLREKRKQDMEKKWGRDRYDDEELEYLENLHQGLIESQNVVGKLNEDQAIKLCKISLIIEQKIREGTDFSKDLKAYDELAKLSNLTPKNVKEASEFDSAGEVFAFLEKTGWVNKYYDNVNRDEVDYTIQNMKNWVRYLYVHETGVAEEIEERIQQLKTAAELEGIEFDEKEFRQYMADEDEIAGTNDEFKLELE